MIYCVEDDDDIRELMLYTLRVAGFEAEGFPSSSSFWEKIGKVQPELIVLDIMMPEDDGLAILSRLNQSSTTSHIPVIMATAKGTEFDKVKGLDLGADDYLVKPFGMMEMVSRIKAVLRRSSNPSIGKRLIFGVISLDLEGYVAKCQDTRLDLTLKEFDLLTLMMENPNRVFTRQDLLDRIWGDSSFVETRTVDVHIGTLRTKLGDYAAYIQTVRGVGYRIGELDD